MNDTSTAPALIAAARDLFAAHGYHAASVRAITTAAGANLGAITYHFGSKRELYDHVVASIVEPLADRVEHEVAQPGPTVQRAGEVVRSYFEYLRTNPDLPQLMMQELVLSGVPPAAVAGPMKRVLAALTSLIAEGQRCGEVRAGGATVLGTFILSVPVHLSMMRRPLEAVAGIGMSDEASFREIVSLARGFVSAGLRAEVADGE